MKTLTLMALSVLCLLTCACKKDKQQKEVSNLYLTANKDNANWVTTWHTFAEIGGAKNYRLIGNKGEEHLNIGVTTNSLNQYVLVSDKTEFYITVGQDVLVARYILDESASNTIDVTNYDMKRVIMEGNFKLTFKRVTGQDSYPTTVTFTNGKFRVSKAYD
jgi:hypothetical protein